MSDNINNTPPIDRIRMGRIQAAIWQQTADDGRKFYNFTLDRSYKDENGDYHSASSFSLQDALLVAKVANLADTRIRKLLDTDYVSSRAEEKYGEDA